MILEARKRKSSNNGLMSDEPGTEQNIHVEDKYTVRLKDAVLNVYVSAVGIWLYLML